MIPVNTFGNSFSKKFNSAYVNQRMVYESNLLLRNLKVFFTLGKYFGVVPIDFENTKRRKKFPRITSFIIMSVFVMESLFYFDQLFRILNPECELFITVQVGSLFLEFFFLIFIITKNIFFNYKQMRKLVDLILASDREYNGWTYGYVPKNLYLKMSTISLLFVGVDFLKYGNSIKDGTLGEMIDHSFEIFIDFYQLAIFSYYLIFTEWIKSKYKYIENFLFGKQKINELDLFRIFRGYKYHKDILSLNNDTLGAIVFGSFLVSVLQILMSIIYALEYGRHEEEDYFINFVSPLKYTVSKQFE